MAIRGRVTFDYSSADGVVAIGRRDSLFETKWTRRDNGSIFAYKDPPSIDAIALATGAAEIPAVRDAARFDYSSRFREPQEGQILLLRNVHGLYAALKIRDIKAIGYGDAVDEVTFDYVILEDGGRDFSELADVQVIDASFAKTVLFIGAGFDRGCESLFCANHHSKMRWKGRVQGYLRRRMLLRWKPPSRRHSMEWTLLIGTRVHRF